MRKSNRLRTLYFAVYILAKIYFYISNTCLHTMNVRMSLKIARRGLHKNNKATVLNHYLFSNLKPTSLCCRLGTVKLKGDYMDTSQRGASRASYKCIRRVITHDTRPQGCFLFTLKTSNRSHPPCN